MKRRGKGAIIRRLKVDEYKKSLHSNSEKLFMLIDARNLFRGAYPDDYHSAYTVLRVIFT